MVLLPLLSPKPPILAMNLALPRSEDCSECSSRWYFIKELICYSDSTSSFLTETFFPVCQVSHDDCTADCYNIGSSLWLSSIAVGVKAEIRVDVVCCWHTLRTHTCFTESPPRMSGRLCSNSNTFYVDKCSLICYIFRFQCTQGVFLFPSKMFYCGTLMPDCFLLSQSVGACSQTRI